MGGEEEMVGKGRSGQGRDGDEKDVIIGEWMGKEKIWENRGGRGREVERGSLKGRCINSLGGQTPVRQLKHSETWSFEVLQHSLSAHLTISYQISNLAVSHVSWRMHEINTMDLQGRELTN
jgi:hypothetical protein